MVLILSFYSNLLSPDQLYALTLTAVAVVSLGATGTKHLPRISCTPSQLWLSYPWALQVQSICHGSAECLYPHSYGSRILGRYRYKASATDQLYALTLTAVAVVSLDATGTKHPLYGFSCTPSQLNQWIYYL